jgi:hypothetical protein
MAYGGKFSSKEDLSGNRQALQVGRDFKPLEGADKVWADMVGMNEDGSFNTWGQVQNQLLSWLGMGALTRTLTNVGRDKIMKDRDDDYGRAYDQVGKQLIDESQNLSWNMSVEGGKATGQIIGMVGAGMAAGGGGAAGAGGVDYEDALGAGTNTSTLMGPPEAITSFDGDVSNVVNATGYGLSSEDKKILGERKTANDLLNKVGGSLGKNTSPTDMALQQSQSDNQNAYADQRLQKNQESINDIAGSMAWGESVPVVGKFITSATNYGLHNDVWKATMEDAINRMDRSLMLDSGEYMA